SSGEAADTDGCRAGPAGVVDIREPEVSHPVTVPVVPVDPPDREVPGLPAAHPDIPGFRDHLHAGEGRVSDDLGQQRMLGGELVGRVTSECDGEIEPEPID